MIVDDVDKTTRYTAGMASDGQQAATSNAALPSTEREGRKNRSKEGKEHPWQQRHKICRQGQADRSQCAETCKTTTTENQGRPLVETGTTSTGESCPDRSNSSSRQRYGEAERGADSASCRRPPELPLMKTGQCGPWWPKDGVEPPARNIWGLRSPEEGGSPKAAPLIWEQQTPGAWETDDYICRWVL